jgi:arginyl-tRNA synthetase
MNIFNTYRVIIERVVAELVADGELPTDLPVDRISIEPPRDVTHGDISTNVALVLAKPGGIKPRDLAELISQRLSTVPGVDSIDVAGPGFVNLRLSFDFWQDQVIEILKAGLSYGDSDSGAGRKVNVEYVSANPTGPMHVGHARGAVIGDVLASLLTKVGCDVTREYYINDAGGQVEVLARSAHFRYREALGERIGAIPDEFYPGSYLVDVGEALAARDGDKWRSVDEVDWLPVVRDFTIDAMMALIREDLSALGIKHDIFLSERTLHDDERIDDVIKLLEGLDLVYWGIL